MTDWKALEHHRGEASDIPKIVAGMLGGPPGPVGNNDRSGLHLDLQDRLYRRGEWVQAAPAAVELLFESMGPEAMEPERIPWHISLLTTGGTRFAVERGLPLHGDAPFQKETLAVALARESTLIEWLGSDDSKVRAISARLLGMLPGGTADRVTALEAYVRRFSDQEDACNGLISLGFLGAQGLFIDPDLLKEMMADSKPPLVRAGAGLSWVWMGRPLEAVVLDALVEAMPPFNELSIDWFLCADLLPFLPGPLTYRQEVAVSWTERSTESTNHRHGPPLYELFALIGACPPPPEGWNEVARTPGPPADGPGELSAIERRLAELSGHAHCAEAVVPSSLPEDWRSRRRWLGLDGLSIMEKSAPWEPVSKAPVWKLWWSHATEEALDEQGIPRAWATATEFERLQLLCEALSGAYSLAHHVRDVDRTEMLELARRCLKEEGARTWALGLLDELSRLPVQDLWAYVGAKNSYVTPLMQVLLEHGTSLPDRFDVFLNFDNAADQKLIARLPLERRRKVLLAAREKWPLYQAIVSLLPVFPFREFASAALETINEKRGAEGAAQRKGNRVLQQLIPLAEEHPEIAEALAEARARPDWVPED